MEKENIAVIGGTGKLGFGLALRFAKKNHKVIIGSRDPQKANAAVEKIKQLLGNADVEGTNYTEATKTGQIVIVAVPFEACVPTLKSIRDAISSEKIVVSVINPLATAVGGMPTEVLGVWQGSAAELVRSMLPPGVPVVSAFQNVAADHFQDIAHPIESDVVVCGDDFKSKERIMKLAACIDGIRPIDGGPLANSKTVEMITALILGINIRLKKTVSIRFTYM